VTAGTIFDTTRTPLTVWFTALACPRPSARRECPDRMLNVRVLRRDCLGGLIHEYAQVA